MVSGQPAFIHPAHRPQIENLPSLLFHLFIHPSIRLPNEQQSAKRIIIGVAYQASKPDWIPLHLIVRSPVSDEHANSPGISSVGIRFISSVNLRGEKNGEACLNETIIVDVFGIGEWMRVSEWMSGGAGPGFPPLSVTQFRWIDEEEEGDKNSQTTYCCNWVGWLSNL